MGSVIRTLPLSAGECTTEQIIIVNITKQQEKNGFAEVFKYLVRYRSENITLLLLDIIKIIM